MHTGLKADNSTLIIGRPYSSASLCSSLRTSWFVCAPSRTRKACSNNPTLIRLGTLLHGTASAARNSTGKSEPDGSPHERSVTGQLFWPKTVKLGVKACQRCQPIVLRWRPMKRSPQIAKTTPEAWLRQLPALPVTKTTTWHRLHRLETAGIWHRRSPLGRSGNGGGL